MNRTALTTLLPVLVAFTLSCGDDSNPAAPATPDRVRTEPANAESATIGASGGSISAVAGNGTIYMLSVPAGALPSPTPITMTPVRAIDGLPRLDALAAGVVLAPDGLAFAAPALLTIETSQVADAGESPLAMSFDGDASRFALALAGDDGGNIVVPVSHFSGIAVGFGSEADRTALLNSLTDTPRG
jgi:hypothetical protein